MTSVASILNDFGIPWPDADASKARDAARCWAALGQSASEAMNQGGSAAAALSAHNTGPAMDMFANYWGSIGGPYFACTAAPPTQMLPVLAEACNALADACDKFADAVDELKTKLEEKAGEIAAAITAGGAATLFTLGISDMVSGGVSAALISVAGADVELFGTTIADIVGAMAVGGIAGGIDTMIDTVLTNGVKAELGENPPSGSQMLMGLVEGTVLGALTGGIGKTATTAAKTAASAAVGNLPDSISKLAPDLPVLLGSIPDALETPAGKALTDISSEYAVKSGVAGVQDKDADAPGLPEILGDLLDAKIEVTGKG